MMRPTRNAGATHTRSAVHPLRVLIATRLSLRQKGSRSLIVSQFPEQKPQARRHSHVMPFVLVFILSWPLLRNRLLRLPRNHPRQRPENRGPRLCLIEARNPVAAHARGHNLEFGAPGRSQLVQGVGTTSSGRAPRKTGVPRRSYSTSSSYSSSSSSMLMAWWSPIDQRATIRKRLHPTYQSPS